MDVVDFENKRWGNERQKLEFRHRAALALVHDGAALDIGCGDGLMLSLLKERGIKGIGLDISDEAVKRCREKGLDARRYAPSQPLPFPDASFDTVILLDVLEHVYDPTALLREAARISRRDLIVSVPNFSSLPARLQTLFGRVPENNTPSKGHLYWFNAPALEKVAREANLSIDRLEMNTFAPFSLLGSFFSRLMPNLFALSFVARLTKAHG